LTGDGCIEAAFSSAVFLSFISAVVIALLTEFPIFCMMDVTSVFNGEMISVPTTLFVISCKEELCDVAFSDCTVA
jgi:hypothetical protein